MRIAALIAVGVLAAQPALGAAPSGAGPRSTEDLVNTPDYQANLLRLFAEMPPDVFRRCPTLVSNGSQVAVLQPPTFNAAGKPVSGYWK